MKSNRKAWVIRANPHHTQRIQEFLRDDLIALGWPKLGDLSGMNRGEIKAILRTSYGTRNRAELGRSAGALDTLVNRVSKNDYVLVPHPKERDIYVGEVSGDYKYDDNAERDGYPHQRKVRWILGRYPIARRDLPASVRRRQQGTSGKTRLPRWGGVRLECVPRAFDLGKMRPCVAAFSSARLPCCCCWAWQ